jgi:hypothetical protein
VVIGPQADVRRTAVGESFVLDGNLGLPVHDPGWAAVLAGLGITAESSSDLVAIDRQVADHRADLAFIPAADYHGFRADPYYTALAMATSTRTGLPVQSSVLVVATEDPARAMVLEDVWAATPANAECTRIVDRVDGLAPPVVLARADLDAAVRDPLLAELLAWRPPPGATYGPFWAFDAGAVAPFFALLDGLQV